MYYARPCCHFNYSIRTQETTQSSVKVSAEYKTFQILGSRKGNKNYIKPAAKQVTMRRAFHLLGKAFRETGQALDRLGLSVANNEIYKETYSRHRPIMNLFDKVNIF
jgi:predicted adenine nucleotide alpha hydrolase (AANH) superfamily ATPase